MDFDSKGWVDASLRLLVCVANAVTRRPRGAAVCREQPPGEDGRLAVREAQWKTLMEDAPKLSSYPP